MRSLSAHLGEAGSHGQLPFHPSCPVCCAERLSGPLPADELLGQRPRALVAAAVLAGSTAAPAIPAIAPAVAVAQDESDDEDAGGAEDPERKSFDDEGGFEDAPEAPLPDASGPPPVTPTPPASPVPSPQAPPTETPTSPAPAPAPAPDNDPAVPEPPSERVVQPDSERDSGDTRRKQASPVPPERPQAPSPPSYDRAEPAAALTPPQLAGAPPAAAPSAPPPATGREAQTVQPAINGPTHRVRQGESLWSIAQRQLDAGASPAAVARLVNRLWELNAARIATGDPDLIMVDTVLRLP